MDKLCGVSIMCIITSFGRAKTVFSGLVLTYFQDRSINV